MLDLWTTSEAQNMKKSKTVRVSLVYPKTDTGNTEKYDVYKVQVKLFLCLTKNYTMKTYPVLVGYKQHDSSIICIQLVFIAFE
jgi:hypothetical protein